MTPLEPEDRAALVDAFARLLADKSAEEDVRKAISSAEGFCRSLWQQIAEMGITGLVVDPKYGGSGASIVELEAIMETAGAALLCAPLLATQMAAVLIEACDDAAANARLLPGIADGSTISTVAITGQGGSWRQEDVAVSAEQDGQEWRLNGSAHYVLYAAVADTVLVVANTVDGCGVFEVAAGGAGMEIHSPKLFDDSVRVSELKLTNVLAQRLGTQGWEAVELMLDVARVALAGEQAGAAEKSFDLTVEYIKTRIQFGRPVGGFQAIKHMAADLLIEKESALSAARHAAKSLATGKSSAPSDISLAAFACADAFSKIAADSIQMHGGIGFTWEYPAHLYLRRARTDAQLLGNSNYYRDRFIAQLEA